MVRGTGIDGSSRGFTRFTGLGLLGVGQSAISHEALLALAFRSPAVPSQTRTSRSTDSNATANDVF